MSAAIVAAVVLLTLVRAPADRVAVVVGNNLGLENELALSFAESDAQRVAKAMTDLESFSPTNIHTLLNRTGDDVRALLRELGASVPAEERPLVLFYFSGHGDGNNLHLSGTRLALSELRRLLAGVSEQLTIAVIDSCKSGAFTHAKGASLGPAYSVDIQLIPEVKGSIVITSSSADELSQESDALEASYFTHHWVAGLYGRADADGDGLVMLEEAYRYAHFRTVETTIASHGGVQHPAYRFDLVGQGNVVLANLRASTARLELHAANTGGRYFIIDPDKGLILTELSQSANGTTGIRLPPGRYRIRKREPRRSLIADVTLEDGDVAIIRDDNMRVVPLGLQADKGGHAVTHLRHGPVFHTGLRNGLIPRMSVTWQAEVGYELAWGAFFLQPRFVFRTAVIEPEAITDSRWQHIELDWGITAGGRIELGELQLSLGGSVGLVFFDRQVLAIGFGQPTPGPPGIQGSVPLGFQGAGVVGVGYPLGPVVITARGFSGVVLFNLEDRFRASFVAGGMLGAAMEL